jgi:hypothetical protein
MTADDAPPPFSPGRAAGGPTQQPSAAPRLGRLAPRPGKGFLEQTLGCVSGVITAVEQHKISLDPKQFGRAPEASGALRTLKRFINNREPLRDLTRQAQKLGQLGEEPHVPEPCTAKLIHGVAKQRQPGGMIAPTPRRGHHQTSAPRVPDRQCMADGDGQVQMFAGLNIFLTRIGDFRGALAVAQKCETFARSLGYPIGIMVADWMPGASDHLIGHQAAARRRCESSLGCALTTDGSSTSFFGYDHRIRARVALARALWLLGFPDRACLIDYRLIPRS